MKSFEINPKERAIVRSHLPDELIEVVDEAEASMHDQLNGILKNFKDNVNSQVEDFTNRDFAQEMTEKLETELKDREQEFSNQVNTLKEQIDKVNNIIKEANNSEENLTKAIEQLNKSVEDLDKTLEKQRDSVVGIGRRIGEFVKKVVKAQLLGFLG